MFVCVVCCVLYVKCLCVLRGMCYMLNVCVYVAWYVLYVKCLCVLCGICYMLNVCVCYVVSVIC